MPSRFGFRRASQLATPTSTYGSLYDQSTLIDERQDVHQDSSWNRLPISRHAWHDDGMNRIRLSTTVDASLLEHARSVRSGTTDAALIDEALAALLARYRSAEVDASYAAYDEHPLEEPDEWGDLASFRRAVASS